MVDVLKLNDSPARKTARVTREQIRKTINEGKSFLVEAGAGAGKTYTLIKTVKFLIGKYGDDLQKQNKKIACITYTNKAVEEIEKKIDNHPIVRTSTIHSFCWSLIERFHKKIRVLLQNINQWQKLLEEKELEDFGTRKIIYRDPAFRNIKENVISLDHNDVLTLTTELLKEEKFKLLLENTYPIILIDEYQDTNKNLIESLKPIFLNDGKPLIGFFGDPWQMIYQNVCGKIEHKNTILLLSNFRSAPVIINFLNKIRPKLPQEGDDPSLEGFLDVYITNDWSGERLKGSHWKGDLPPNVSNDVLDLVINNLAENGWDFNNDKTKILMLTHNNIAVKYGYSNLADLFKPKSRLIKKEDPYIQFFIDTLEPVCKAYKEKLYGEMFSILGGRSLRILNHKDKLSWKTDMDKILQLREEGLIGEVLDHLKITKRPHLPDIVKVREEELTRFETIEGEKDPSIIMLTRRLREISYKEIIKVAEFIEEHTVFQTKHGVKGSESENILIVFGRGWNFYNWNNYLDWEKNGIPNQKENMYERTRNLFYVSCSRAKRRLVLLFTQSLSEDALETLNDWVGPKSIHSIQFEDDVPSI